MASKYEPRVKQTASNKPDGSSGFILPEAGGSGLQSFEQAGYTTNDIAPYYASNGVDWEEGLGVFNPATNILGRQTVIKSSSSNAPIDWSAGGNVEVLVSPHSDYLNQSSLALEMLTPGGRLTPTTGVPYQTTLQSNVTRVYYTPFIHNLIKLWNGASWRVIQFSEVFFDIGTRANTFPFDVFAYLDNGQMAFELVQWAGNVTRAVETVYDEGVLVKSGDKSRLYLGTVGCVTTTTTDSSNIFNHYNRRWFRLASTTDGTSHPYTTASWRNWNNGTGLPLMITVGQPTLGISYAYCRFYSGLFQASGIVSAALAGNESGGTLRLTATGNSLIAAGKRTQTFQQYGSAAGGNWNEAAHSITWEC